MAKKLSQRDTAELAVWVTDDDPPSKLKWWKTEEAPRLFEESAEAAGMKLSPIRWYELKPGEGRAGTPPKGIQGTNVRLLVAECDVVGMRPIANEAVPFTLELSRSDLKKLRDATRRAYGLVIGSDGKTLRKLRADECDKIINLLGPEAAAREAVNATVH